MHGVSVSVYWFWCWCHSIAQTLNWSYHVIRYIHICKVKSKPLHGVFSKFSGNFEILRIPYLHSPGSADNKDDSGVSQDSHQRDSSIEHREKDNDPCLKIKFGRKWLRFLSNMSKSAINRTRIFKSYSGIIKRDVGVVNWVISAVQLRDVGVFVYFITEILSLSILFASCTAHPTPGQGSPGSPRWPPPLVFPAAPSLS